MIAFAVSWIGSVIGIFYALPFFNYLSPDNTNYPIIAGINVLFLLGIPIASLILLITRLLFGTRVQTRWKAGMIGFMILNAISLSFIGTSILRDFETGTTQSQGVDLSAITSDTIRLTTKAHPYEDTWFQIGDELKFTDEVLISEMVEIDIRKSDGDDFELVQENHARGKSLEAAQDLAIAIPFQVEQTGPNQIAVPNAFQIPNGEKWRNQQVKLTLEIPVGKSILIEEGINLHDVDLDDRRVNPWRERGKVWRMETTGLVCTNCDNIENEQQYSFSNFDKIKVDGKLKVEIDHGETFKINITGKPHYVDRVDLVELDSTLNISATLDKASSPVRLYITMPYLDDIQIEGTDDVSIRGFQQPRITIHHQGGDEVKAYVEVDTLVLRQTDHSKLDIYGKYQHLDAQLTDNAKLDAEKASLKTANIRAEAASRVFLPLLNEEELKYEKDESSTVKVEGATVQ